MTTPVASGWKLTFDEEFNGTSINTSVWGTNWLGNDGAITKPINSSELGAYDPARVRVSDGLLHLTAVAVPATVNGVSYDYRSGIVQTYDSFWQTFGYFEARIKLEGSSGRISNWPAFWLDGKTWPVDGEIDIMEGLEGEASYHTHSPAGGPGDSVAGDFTGWHTYGALWEPGKVSFYYDNKFVGQITGYNLTSPNYLILNLGIGEHSIIDVPAEMQVDWVHVYSSNAASRAVTPQAGYTGPGGEGLPSAGTGGSGGTATADFLSGTGSSDRLDGKAGNDTIIARGANDIIIGGTGHDIMSGNAGADTFDFNTIRDSIRGAGRDIIRDFTHLTDRLDLSGIDASLLATGNQRFHFIGQHAFTERAGELHYRHVNATGTTADKTIVEGDVTGDARADFQIELTGLKHLALADFVL